MKVEVLRLGHRLQRDERISTHVGLVARAFGADTVILSGDKDVQVVHSLEDVVDRWGGTFQIQFQPHGRHVIKTFDGMTVLLSMYGMHLNKGISEIRHTNPESLLVVLGGKKVPGDIYGLVDRNISVTNQPHSEVAALAVFLHELFQGKELDTTFDDASIRVIPQREGKKVKRRNKNNDNRNQEEEKREK